MAADPELRELALSIVNGLTDINEQPEPPDRVVFVERLIWNFFYGANGRIAKEKVDRETAPFFQAMTGAEFVAAAQAAITPLTDEELRAAIEDLESR